MRERLLKSCDPDIALITETKLIKDNTLMMDGYVWYGNNRQCRSKKMTCGSGGVGIFVKCELLQEYDVYVVDIQFDGVLIITLTDKFSGLKLTTGVCYLPPERSKYGRNSLALFHHLLGELYNVIDSDLIVFGGDLNARIGQMQDTIPEVDDIRPRTVLDKTKNSHGQDFIQFLLEAKVCLLNGRFESLKDNYTSVSGKGKAVVDYLFTMQTMIDYIVNFEVKTVVELANKYHCAGEKLPDHSIVVCDINIFEWDNAQDRHESATQNVSKKLEKTELCERKVYNLPKNIDTLFNSERWTNEINSTIDRIERTEQNQTEINKDHEFLLKSVTNIIGSCCPVVSHNKNRSKSKAKPWWSTALNDAWKGVVDSERKFLQKGQTHDEKQRRHEQYKITLKLFDKMHRKAKRRYKSEEANSIEELETCNPREFWQKLKGLGPSKRPKLFANGICCKDGSVATDPCTVRSEVSDYFESLFNPVLNDMDFDDTFYRDLLKTKDSLENSSAYFSNNEISIEFSMEEFQEALKKVKNGKAMTAYQMKY